MIGGRRPLQGRKPADRRVRVERPHSPVLPLHGPRPDGREGRRPRAEDGPRADVGADPQGRDRPAARRARRRPASGCRRRRRSRSSAPTRSARRPTRRRRSSGSSRSPARRRSRSRSASRSRSRSCSRSSRLSYRQVCRAYPGGGGAYAVAKENLSPLLGPRRGGGPADRLRDDGRGLDRVGDRPDRVGRARASRRSRSRSPSSSIALMTVANLRGLRESGNIFAIPTYALPRPRPADGRARAGQHRHRRGPPDRDAERRGPAAAASCRSSCSSRRSPAARSP